MYRPPHTYNQIPGTSVCTYDNSHVLRLSDILNGYVEDGIIHINDKSGKGTVQVLQLAPGLELQCWNVNYQQFHQFASLLFRAAATNYSFIYSLTPEHFQFRRRGQAAKLTGSLLISADMELDFLVVPDALAKAIIINVTSQWILEEYRSANAEMVSLAHDLFAENKSLFCTDTVSFALHHTFRAMHDEELRNPGDIFFARSRTSSVIYDLLARLLPVHSIETHKMDNLLHARMTAVEQLLNEHLRGQLPPLAAIASSIAVSESTLKRNFKKVYGVGIYEYYLQKKMQLARQLLDEKPIPIKEIAYILGYEKTSNFIKIFKKYYALSPGALKKKYPGNLPEEPLGDPDKGA